MSKIRLLVVLLLLHFQLLAQTTGKIEVNVHKAPLNQVLLDLKESYGFQFAFDSDLLSGYTISANKTFRNQEETLKFLIKNLPLDLERSGDVFLIVPHQEQNRAISSTRISGQVLEAVTNEPLPYSYVVVNRKPVQADQLGNFNYIASADSGLNLQISHLGYYVYDTIVNQSIEKKFFLTPRIQRISEVQILSNPVEEATLIGDKAGHIKINHQIAPILPGHGDNSVFTLLRLMPGILAAGEQSNDLLIWGAYESQSKIEFDGFTLFGLKNFNDNIAVVNPFMVKNIEVLKGGYGVRYGDKVGGIVDIIGKDGTLQKPTFTFNINSTTINGMVQVPVSKHASLIGAYRQTYYQLYDPTSLSLFTRPGNSSGRFDGNNSPHSGREYQVTPDYIFRDANLKYSYKGKNGERFAVSLYGGGDLFKYNMDREISRFMITRSEKEQNRQYGGSAQYSLPWADGSNTLLSFAFSAFNQQKSEENHLENSNTGFVRTNLLINSENTVEEISAKAEHVLYFQEGHKLMFAAGAINNHVRLFRENGEETTFDLENNLPRFYVFAQDEIPLLNIVELRTGLRLTYAARLNEFFVQPRVSASVKLNNDTKLNAAWGIYNQYTAKATLVDSADNYTNFWVNADNQNIPVLSAQHFVGGISYNKDKLIASAEAFYKTTNGLTQYFSGVLGFPEGFYKGEARSYGIDLFVRKEYKRHVAWISYTLSRVEEHFPFYVREYYHPAPQHQKHELKLATILNYKSFYFSANYVYGSGFERFDIETDAGIKLNQPYNRADASLVYKFKPGKVRAEAGISILNVFNTDNIKYSNLRVTSADDLSLVGIYADAVPFTPTVFIKVEF
ncbi:MAG TPA: TonB-dependent receptor plug domain-containing protein [Draconibacterium sp.]|nr:TonB-dependent receptor plug domain-containing protein [Draconibacterium sp.]